jgi:hypothetical protein
MTSASIQSFRDLILTRLSEGARGCLLTNSSVSCLKYAKRFSGAQRAQPFGKIAVDRLITVSFLPVVPPPRWVAA